ncbi:MAG: hypothetical protein M3N43_05850 [Actinomycetota bacterium]|nr:hypothetical protein [Actinomycetota bacterium]
MSEQSQYPGPQTSSPAVWLILGVAFAGIGAAVMAGGDEAQAFGAVIAVVGGILLTLGIIAKGVEIGIRSARD